MRVARWAGLLGIALTLILLDNVGGAPDAKQASDAGKPVRVDALGDPLPAGALLRLGTTRLRHFDYLNSLTFSPDGKTLVSVGRDAVRAWDVASGKESPSFGKEGEGAYSAAFFPDGKTLAVGDDQGVALWDVGRGQLVSRFREEKYGRGAHLLAVSPDGETLAVGISFIGTPTIYLREAKTGKPVSTLEGFEWGISSLAFSPDGKSLVACTHPPADEKNANHVTLWELPKQRPKWQAKLSGIVNSVSFFPDGNTIAVGARKGPVRYLSASTGERCDSPDLNGCLVALAPDGKTLAVARTDRTVRLCDPVSGRERHLLQRHFSEVNHLAFSPDGKILATGGGEGTVILWDTATGREMHPLPGHRHRVGGVTFSPDGRFLASLGGDRTIRVWDLASGNEALRLAIEPQDEWDWVAAPNVNMATGLAYSPDGRLLASWGKGRQSILVWDARTGRRQSEWKGHRFRITSLGISPDGKTLASGDYGGEVRLWGLAEGKLAKWLKGVPPGDRRWAECTVAFSPDGKRLAFFSIDGVELWDLVQNARLSTAPGWTTSVLFVAEGQILAAACPNTTPAIRLMDSATGKELRVLTWESKNKGSGFGRLSLAVSPDGRYLASTDSRFTASAGQSDWDTRVWDLLAGQQVRHLFGHRGPVNGVAFSPDGRKLATVGEDGTVLVWDLLALPRDDEELLQRGLDAAALDRLWSDLAGGDHQRAYQTMAMLTRSPAKAVPLIRSRVQPVAKGEGADVTKLIADLDNEEFGVREAATRGLRDLGIEAAPDVARALDKVSSAEARRRLQALVDHYRTGAPAPDVLRRERALTVLEWISSEEANTTPLGLHGYT